MSFRRIAGYAGLAGVVLLIVNTIVAGETPAFDATAAEVLEYYADYEWTATLLLSALIGPVLVLFSVGFYRAARDGAGGDTSAWAVVGLVGLIASFAAVFGFNALDVALGARGAGLGAATVDALWAMTTVFFAYQVASVAVLLLGFGMVTLRAGIGPRWAGYVALAGAAAGFLGSLGAAAAIDSGSPLMMVGLVAYIAWLVWTAAVSVTMLRTADGAAAA